MRCVTVVLNISRMMIDRDQTGENGRIVPKAKEWGAPMTGRKVHHKYASEEWPVLKDSGRLMT